MADLKDGAKAIRRLSEALDPPEGLSEAYARAVLDQAVQTASSRPTPQAPMAAAAMGIQGDTISVLSEGAPAEVSGGSEWGSNIYTQFGPRNERGWWLMPASESREASEAGDRYLEQMAEKAVRGLTLG